MGKALLGMTPFVRPKMALRYSEISGAGRMWPLHDHPTIDQAIALDNFSRYEYPIDSMTDAEDVYALCCGKKGIPQDKSQRLIILSLREKRLLGKVRRSYWVNTQSMTANPLTKYNPQMIAVWMLMTEGYLSFKGPTKVTRHARMDHFTELDLVQDRLAEVHQDGLRDRRSMLACSLLDNGSRVGFLLDCQVDLHM